MPQRLQLLSARRNEILAVALCKLETRVKLGCHENSDLGPPKNKTARVYRKLRTQKNLDLSGVWKTQTLKRLGLSRWIEKQDPIIFLYFSDVMALRSTVNIH